MRSWRGRGLLGWLAVVGLTTAGCLPSAGSKLSLFPEGNRLSDSAQALRTQSAPPPGIARELDKQVSGPYVIEPGDVLLVQPASLDSPVRLPGDQPVLADGSIQLGRFGRIQVVGKTLEQIEAEVNGQIKAQVNDAGPIVVRLVTRDSKVFYVLGEVNAPGSFQVKGRETVLDAIVAAGGLNSNASRRGIILTRPTAPDSCRIVLPVDYNAIVQDGNTCTNYQIRAGDRIFIPCRSTWEDLANCFGDKKSRKAPPPVSCMPAASIGAPVPLATTLPATIERPVPPSGQVLPPPFPPDPAEHRPVWQRAVR
jgi:protein involved in polysaccharide export with SLBB domain